MKRILSLVFFFAIASLHADDAAKWEGYVKKFQKNLKVAKSRLNVSKKNLAAQPGSAKWQGYVKKYTALVAKYEKNIGIAQARLEAAKKKEIISDPAPPVGPPVNTNLTAPI